MPPLKRANSYRNDSCFVLSLLFFTFLSGCGFGTKKLQTIEVSGLVTLDGKRLDRALIFFDPITGKSGPRVSGLIRNGEYFLEPDTGPVVGSLRVAIVSETADETPAPNEPAKRYAAEKIPKHYNSQSILVVETTLDGSNHFDFNLRSQRQ
ncbi:MAG: hypothetical protein JWN70_215 [Planctomycetaceae bacterium]|nr:hypothetical protein [Planctomycetaceae bacterium]